MAEHNSNQEDNEDSKKEALDEKGIMDLCQHKNKIKRNRSKSWICKSINHYKKQCPKIRCFYCNRMGHIKTNCYFKKIDFIFQRLIDGYKARKERKAEVEERKIT